MLWHVRDDVETIRWERNNVTDSVIPSHILNAMILGDAEIVGGVVGPADLIVTVFDSVPFFVNPGPHE
jgi:hypothetical protein